VAAMKNRRNIRPNSAVRQGKKLKEMSEENRATKKKFKIE
jgi:hypothetical protein